MNYTEQYHWTLGGKPKNDKMILLRKTEEKKFLLYKKPDIKIVSEPAYVLKSVDGNYACKEYSLTAKQIAGQYKDIATNQEVTLQILNNLQTITREIKSETKLQSYYRSAFLDKTELALLTGCISSETIKDELVFDEMNKRLKNNHILPSDIKKESSPFDYDCLEKFEQYIGYPFKEEMQFYLMKLGGLSYKNTQLYNANLDKGMSSEIVQETMKLHKRFPETKKYVVLSCSKKDRYILIDKNDMVYTFTTQNKENTPLNQSISEYIMSQFRDAAQSKNIQPVKYR